MLLRVPPWNWRDRQHRGLVDIHLAALDVCSAVTICAADHDRIDARTRAAPRGSAARARRCGTRRRWHAPAGPVGDQAPVGTPADDMQPEHRVRLRIGEGALGRACAGRRRSRRAAGSPRRAGTPASPCRAAPPRCAASTSATAIRMAVWQSWPQACITGTSAPSHCALACEANGTWTSSATGRASMSARRATTGPAPAPPRRTPTTPVTATPSRTS